LTIAENSAAQALALNSNPSQRCIVLSNIQYHHF
jgi:hypothetical protein